MSQPTTTPSTFFQLFPSGQICSPPEVVHDTDGLGSGCVLCHEPDFLRGAFGDRTIMICDTCEREFHVGCLRDYGRADLKEVRSTRKQQMLLDAALFHGFASLHPMSPAALDICRPCFASVSSQAVGGPSGRAAVYIAPDLAYPVAWVMLFPHEAPQSISTSGCQLSVHRTLSIALSHILCAFFCVFPGS